MQKNQVICCKGTEWNCILNSDYPALPEKCVDVQILRIFDQVALRKRITRNIALEPGEGVYRPEFTFYGMEDFSIINAKIISSIELDKKKSLKKVDFIINTKYNLLYSDGFNRLVQSDEANFELIINRVYYPEAKTKCFTKEVQSTSTYISRGDKATIEVEASGKAFGEVLCPCTGALIIDIGAFFIIRFGQESQITIPSYALNKEREWEKCRL